MFINTDNWVNHIEEKADKQITGSNLCGYTTMLDIALKKLSERASERGTKKKFIWLIIHTYPWQYKLWNGDGAELFVSSFLLRILRCTKPNRFGTSDNDKEPNEKTFRSICILLFFESERKLQFFDYVCTCH